MHALDLVCNVRDHLHGLPEKLAAAFLLDHRLIDLAGRVVRVAREWAAGESLVMPQIEIGLRAVVQHVDLAVLVGTHRPGVDVQIRVELLHADRQPAPLEEHADRSRRQSLAERADDATGDEYVLGHSGRAFRGEDRSIE